MMERKQGAIMRYDDEAHEPDNRATTHGYMIYKIANL